MVTQNGSEPEKVFDFPDRIRFMIHTGPNSAIEGWAEFKSDRLVGYLTDKNARSIADVVRQGAKIKAHMYFEIAPDIEAKS